MLSSPQEIEQFWIRKFAPDGSMPSVFGELAEVLIVTPKTVALVFGELNAMWNCPGFCSVSPVTSTLVARVNWIRRGRFEIVPALNAAHHGAPLPSIVPPPLTSTLLEPDVTVMKCAGEVLLFG